jgi:3D (Asp-Asp-Asp) domain-containing protein
VRLLITLLLTVILSVFAVQVVETHTYHQRLGQEITELRQEIENTGRDIIQLQKTLDGIESELEKWSVYEVTAYAPLDPDAIEGMCYEGNPNITASGEQVVPGVTLAAAPSVPFGTEVYIRGLGRRVVQDRGGMIGDKQLDIAVRSRAEALSWGRRLLLVREG